MNYLGKIGMAGVLRKQSSFSFYYEIAHAAPSTDRNQRSEVPAAVAHMPLDVPLPRERAERNVNLEFFGEFQKKNSIMPG